MASFLLAVTLFSALVAGASAQVCDPADQKSLLDFKAQFDDPENGLEAWTPDSNCCTWMEVQCDPNGRVTRISLTDTFTRFDLSDGYQLKVKQGVNGAGASLGRLTELQELFIRRVSFGFAHPIPSEFGNLQRLSRLTLLDCEFIGEIPPSLGNLLQLTALVIYKNSLSGPAIPDTFGNLQLLQTLSLTECGLTSLGSEKLTLLKSLQTLDLEGNKISGTIPAWLGRLTSVTMLRLSKNPFTGPIPGELCDISSLVSLYIANTGVTAIPASIGNCKSLKVLILVNNKLRGTLPPGLGLLRSMETLALGSDDAVNFNRMTGRLLPAIGALPQLLSFDVANNDFFGRIPNTYGPYQTFKVDPSLTRFQGNNLSGEIPVDLRNLPVDRFQPGNPLLCGTPLEACK